MERPYLGNSNAINDAAIMHKILSYTSLNEVLNNAVGLLQLMETEGWVRGLCDAGGRPSATWSSPRYTSP